MLADIDIPRGLVPIIGLFVIWGIKQISQMANKDKAAPPPATSEQARRVQEEIRRKIAERRSGAAPVQPSRPSMRPLAPPIAAPRPISTPAPNLRDLLAGRVREREAADARRAADVLAAKRADDDATDRAIAMPLAPTAPARIKTYLGVPEAKTRSASITNLGEDLRDPERLRRAFVLREILSAPVGLR